MNFVAKHGCLPVQRGDFQQPAVRELVKEQKQQKEELLLLLRLHVEKVKLSADPHSFRRWESFQD